MTEMLLCDFCKSAGRCTHAYAYFDCPALRKRLGLPDSPPVRQPARHKTPTWQIAVGVAALLGAIMFSALAWMEPRASAPLAVTAIDRPPGSWRFQPHADMTPAEAAASIALMFNGPDFIGALSPRIEAMPPELRRHWLAPEPTEPAPHPH